MDDIVRGGRWLDIPDRRGSYYGFYSSSGLEMHYGYHHHHPYRRSEKKYSPNEFKKAKPPIFNGEMKKLEDEGAWLLGMKNCSSYMII